MNRKRAFTLTEILVVIVILSILSAGTYLSMRPMLLRSSVTSEMVKFKGMINRARAAAMENSAPVRVDLAGGRLLALVDLDRGGDFGADVDGNADINELVVGEALDTGAGLSRSGKSAVFVQAGDSDLGTDPIPHPSGAYDVEPANLMGFSTFENDQFIVTPRGLVLSALPPYTPVRGTFFIKSTDGFLLTLIHVTGTGEVKTATKHRNEGTWVWQ